METKLCAELFIFHEYKMLAIYGKQNMIFYMPFFIESSAKNLNMSVYHVGG